ncbi:MAG: hypothetical protein AAGA66_10265 [Bacteroidota bacterium]
MKQFIYLCCLLACMVSFAQTAEQFTDASARKQDDFARTLPELNEAPEFKGLSPIQQQKLINDLAESEKNTDEVSNGLAGAMSSTPTLIDAWKVLDDAGVEQALRSDPDKLAKVNRYLDHHPTNKDRFVEDLKKTSDPEKFIDRTFWIDALIQQYGNDVSQFTTQGLSRTDVPPSTVDDMLHASSAPADIRQGIVDDLIHSGSTVPFKVDIQAGDALFKISPKGNGVSDFSPYWVTKRELDDVRSEENLEQKLGLPLGSHGVEYEVFKITATTDVSAFTSTIAPTLQNGYATIGGATQTLVLDRTLWSAASKVATFIP